MRQEMVPELDPLTEVELVLAAGAEAHGGKADGWGCFAMPLKD